MITTLVTTDRRRHQKQTQDFVFACLLCKENVLEILIEHFLQIGFVLLEILVPGCVRALKKGACQGSRHSDTASDYWHYERTLQRLQRPMGFRSIYQAASASCGLNFFFNVITPALHDHIYVRSLYT